jgi:predicted lipoprotein with Yx(FWY)xxD motif
MATSRTNTSHSLAVIGFGLVLSGVLAACGGNQNQASSSSTPSPTAKPTVEFRDAGAKGKVLVASSNQMTVYTFTKDTANSGKSACTGACLAKWPALTVTAGQAPMPGSGVSGTLATSVRADDGTTQVTYNGLPLYFFSNDKAPGDTNGDYQNWLLVKPTT